MPWKKSKNIIFIHGWASGPYVWLRQASHFNNKCKVHTPRLEGDGAGITDFIIKNKLDDICLVGWSLGGMISMQAAAQLKGKVSRLVLIGAPAQFTQKAVMGKIYNKMEKDFQGTLEWFYKFCFSSNERSRNEFSHIIKLVGDFIEPLDKEEVLTGLKILMEMDVRHILDKITMPALIIQGGQDRVCPPEAAQFLARRLKNAKVKLFETAGHAPFLTHPEEVNLLIEEFIT